MLAEIIAAVSEKEGIEHNPFLNDKASGLYNTAYGIGTFLAPLIGAALTKEKGFRSCCDVMAFASLILFVLYFMFSILPNCFGNNKPNRKITDYMVDGNYE